MSENQKQRNWEIIYSKGRGILGFVSKEIEKYYEVNPGKNQMRFSSPEDYFSMYYSELNEFEREFWKQQNFAKFQGFYNIFSGGGLGNWNLRGRIYVPKKSGLNIIVERNIARVIKDSDLEEPILENSEKRELSFAT